MGDAVSRVDKERRFKTLDFVIESSGNLRPHGETIRRVIAIWIPDEERVNGLKIESTMRPIVRFLDDAPGLQPEDGRKVVTERDIHEHMSDVCFKTNLAPCVVKVIQELRYGPNELYQLRWDDFKRLEGAIIAVRTELRVDIPPSVHVKTWKEEDRESGLSNARG
jgi:hypothetical protein